MRTPVLGEFVKLTGPMREGLKKFWPEDSINTLPLDVVYEVVDIGLFEKFLNITLNDNKLRDPCQRTIEIDVFGCWYGTQIPAFMYVDDIDGNYTGTRCVICGGTGSQMFTHFICESYGCQNYR